MPDRPRRPGENLLSTYTSSSSFSFGCRRWDLNVTMVPFEWVMSLRREPGHWPPENRDRMFTLLQLLVPGKYTRLGLRTTVNHFPSEGAIVTFRCPLRSDIQNLLLLVFYPLRSNNISKHWVPFLDLSMTSLHFVGSTITPFPALAENF